MTVGVKCQSIYNHAHNNKPGFASFQPPKGSDNNISESRRDWLIRKCILMRWFTRDARILWIQFCIYVKNNHPKRWSYLPSRAYIADIDFPSHPSQASRSPHPQYHPPLNRLNPLSRLWSRSPSRVSLSRPTPLPPSQQSFAPLNGTVDALHFVLIANIQMRFFFGISFTDI